MLSRSIKYRFRRNRNRQFLFQADIHLWRIFSSSVESGGERGGAPDHQAQHRRPALATCPQ